MTTAGDHGAIELVIPARPDLLQLVRMAAGVVAARAALGFEDVEDLRLAVDELCLPLMGADGHDGRLLLDYRWDEDSIGISCRSTNGGGRRDALSSQILDALVDEHGESQIDGMAAAWLTFRRQPPTEGLAREPG